MYAPQHTWWGWASIAVSLILALLASCSLLDFAFTKEWVWVLPVAVGVALLAQIILLLVLWLWEQPKQKKKTSAENKAKMRLVSDYWLIIVSLIMTSLMLIAWVIFLVTTTGLAVPLKELPVTEEDFDTWQHHIVAKLLALMTAAHFAVELAIFLCPIFGVLLKMGGRSKALTSQAASKDYFEHK